MCKSVSFLVPSFIIIIIIKALKWEQNRQKMRYVLFYEKYSEKIINFYDLFGLGFFFIWVKINYIKNMP